MSKPDSLRQYPLIPSQETMFYMLKYSLHKQVTNVPTSFAIDKTLDFDLLLRALEQEIRRNDCMRIRFVRTRRGIRQYFLPQAPTPDVPILHFDTVQAQEAYCNADASRPLDIFRGETFRVCFFTDPAGKHGVYLNATHPIMDALATSVFYRDLLAVYDALASGTELPPVPASFEAHLQKEFDYLHSPQYEKDAQFIADFHRSLGAPFYAGVHGPDLLNKQRRLLRKPELGVPIAFDPFHDKAQTFRAEADEAVSEKIFAFAASHGTSPEILLQTGYKLHAGLLNGRAHDTMLMALCSRRVTQAEKYMGGCLTQPIQMRTQTTPDMTFARAVKNASDLRMSLYRHMHYPYMDALETERRIYHFTRAQGPALMMYTWLPIDQLASCFDCKIEYRGYALDRYIMPLYTFTFRVPGQNRIRFYYLYRVNTITRAQIEALHAGCLRALQIGIDNPDIPLGALFDALENQLV